MKSNPREIKLANTFSFILGNTDFQVLSHRQLQRVQACFQLCVGTTSTRNMSPSIYGAPSRGQSVVLLTHGDKHHGGRWSSTHESLEGKQLLHFWAQLRIFHRFAPKKKDLVLWQDRSKCKAQIKNLWAASYWKIKPLQFNKFCFILWFYLAPGLQLSSDLLKMKQSMLKEDGKKNFSWKRIFLGVHWFY